MKLITLVAGIAMAVVTPLALAIDTGYYGVVDVGQSTASRACDSSLQTANIGGSSNFSCADKATSYGPSIGYQFNENLAIEGGYFRMGKFSYRFDTTACGGCSVASSDEFSELRFSIIGYLPPANNFALFGKAGAERWSRTGTGTSLTTPFQVSETGFDFLLGIGAKYVISQSLAVRAQLETQGVGGGLKQIDMISIGLIFQ